MFPTCPNTFLPHFLILLLAFANVISCRNQQDLEAVQMAHAGLQNAVNWARRASPTLQESDDQDHVSGVSAALGDCAKLYEEADQWIERLVSEEGHSREDAVTWLSGALASHRSCLDGMEEQGLVYEMKPAQNLTDLLGEALADYAAMPNLRNKSTSGRPKQPVDPNVGGLLASWNAATSKSDLVVAKDGSGNYKSINEAVAALAKMGGTRSRAVIYVKTGVYNEKVEIQRNMRNVMFVGDGIDKTIVSGSRSVGDGASTFGSATFGVSGDGFWARDLTFENTAGPQKHQAVALRVSSDRAVFYRCGIKGYQDTLWAHSLRQFYRDCHIYGTVDFIFGDASVVFQNCDIYVRRPMDHQSNMITAQGRDNPNENTGISIVNSRVVPAPEFGAVKGRFRSYLGRPWKKYSRTVFLKTDLDGLIDPKGWTEWGGSFALSTLYYGEYMNSGSGASTGGRVRWPGFHVLKDSQEASPFTIRNFMQGESWIPATGVPFGLDF